MPVMEDIRASANNPWMKALFGIIVLVFVFWGIGTGGAPTSQVIAEVNGQRITDTQFQRVMRNLSRDQQGAGTDADQKRLAEQVVAQLIEQETLLQEAERIGIVVSSDEVARYVLKYDAFRDSDGDFSQKLYKRTLKRMGLTQGKFEEQIRDQKAIEKMLNAVTRGVHVSDGQVHRKFLQDETKVALKLLRIPDAVLLDDVLVDEATLTTFVTTNEAEIRQRYEQDYRRLYKKPRRATLSQILLRNDLDGTHPDPRPRLEAILAQARGGADFAALARTYSEDINARTGGNLGTVAEEQLDESVSAAVFNTSIGGITDIVPIKNGIIIAKVKEIIPAEETTFDQAKHDIARTLTAEQNVGPVAEALAAEVLADWQTSGSPPEAKLTAQGISALDSGLFSLGRPTVPGLSDSPALIRAITQASTPGLLNEVFPVAGGHMIAEITAYERPDDTAFEKDKQKIRRRMQFSARRSFVDAWREDMVSRADVKQYYVP
jgi:peptidyl-prolyl cis-trans isomerase D